MDTSCVALRAICAALLVTLLIVALWVHDAWGDRKHTVLVKSETPIFVGGCDEDCEDKRLTSRKGRP
jgi:hypothetical protein